MGVVALGATVAVALGACDGSATPAPLGPLREMLPDLPADVWPDGADRHDVFTRLSEALRDPVRPVLAALLVLVALACLGAGLYTLGILGMREVQRLERAQ